MSLVAVCRMRNEKHKLGLRDRLAERLWWMDRDDPRFASTHWARIGYAAVWAAGFVVLLTIAEVVYWMLQNL